MQRVLRVVSLVSVLTLILALGHAAQAQTTTLTTVADTYLKKGSPNQNHGTETVLSLQHNGNNRPLLRVDQTAIAAAVGSDSLRLFITRG